MTEEFSKLTQQDIKWRKQASILSLIVGTAIMLVKFWAYNMTDSQAIYSDALESVVNVVTAISTLFVIYYSMKPVDQDHPYGHGKVEYFSSAFEGGLIAFAAILIFVEAIKAFIQKVPLHELSNGIAIVVVAGLANLVLGVFLVSRGKKVNSVALKASGQHVISDFWTSAGIVVGLIFVYFTKIYWIDSVLAMIVGFFLVRTGYKIVRESISGLMDEEDLDVLDKLAKVFSRSVSPGIIQIHHVKVIRSGWYHHIDAHLVMPEFWDVEMAHNKINEFESSVLRNYDYSGEMNFHLDPCRRAYCKVCDLENCSIRKEEYQSRIPVNLKHMRSAIEPDEFRESE